MTTVPNAVSSKPRTPSVRPWWRSASSTQPGGFSLIDAHILLRGLRPSACRRGSELETNHYPEGCDLGILLARRLGVRVARGWCTVTVWSADETPGSEEEASLLEFETLISELSSRFINLPPGEVDREIEEVQRRVCEVLGVDLSALWESTGTGGPLMLDPLLQLPRGSAPPMRGMSAQEYFPWLEREMLAGRVVAAASLDELPEAAALDREQSPHVRRPVESDPAAHGGRRVARRRLGLQRHHSRSAIGPSRW